MKLDELATQLGLDLAGRIPQNIDFPFKITTSWAERIRPDNFCDPLLLQVLPQLSEQKIKNGYDDNPLRETDFVKLPGLLHKYRGKVLIEVSNRCALNCRFCFRRYVRTAVEDWQMVEQYLQSDPTIHEAILSGGDPLVIAQLKLQMILTMLSKIKHLKRIRIHTRIPVVMPELITRKWLRNLDASLLPIVMVIHCNHPQEINSKVARVLRLLRGYGITLFNQSVLLKGINDDSTTLIELSEKLFALGVIPYYLHQLDHVHGASHFAVGLKRAKRLHTALKHSLPGYLVPKLIRETLTEKKYL